MKRVLVLIQTNGRLSVQNHNPFPRPRHLKQIWFSLTVAKQIVRENITTYLLQNMKGKK